MDYRKFGDTVVARFDRGEEFTSSLQELCEKENIKLASRFGDRRIKCVYRRSIYGGREKICEKRI